MTATATHLECRYPGCLVRLPTEAMGVHEYLGPHILTTNEMGAMKDCLVRRKSSGNLTVLDVDMINEVRDLIDGERRTSRELQSQSEDAERRHAECTAIMKTLGLAQRVPCWSVALAVPLGNLKCSPFYRYRSDAQPTEALKGEVSQYDEIVEKFVSFLGITDNMMATILHDDTPVNDSHLKSVISAIMAERNPNQPSAIAVLDAYLKCTQRFAKPLTPNALAACPLPALEDDSSAREA